MGVGGKRVKALDDTLQERGASLRHVQAFLGHERILTTVLYTRISVKKLKGVYRSPHPFELDTPNK